MFCVGLGKQGNRRRNQAIIHPQVFLLALLKIFLQHTAINCTNKSLTHLLITECRVSLIKYQCPNGAFCFFAGHTLGFCLFILFVICKAAVRFSIHQQIKITWSLLASFFLCSSLHITLHIKINPWRLYLSSSIIFIVFL